MKLIDLFEGKHPHNPSEIAHLIKTNCKKWLDLTKNVPIYRGDKSFEYTDFYTSEVKQNRDPVGISNDMHNKFVTAMVNQGFKAHRGNSIFGTSNVNQAGFYSSSNTIPHIIFPIGDVNYAWNTMFSDLIVVSRHLEFSDQKEIDNFVSKYYKNNEGIDLAIKKGHELLINCKEYYGVSKDLWDDMQSFMLGESALMEGVYDRYTFKAIFMAGSPGAGKTFISNKLTDGFGLRKIDSDLFIEKIFNVFEPNRLELVHGKSKGISERQFDLYINNRLGIVVDGTGKNFDRIKHTRRELDELGYDTLMVFVDTDLDTSIKRNKSRKRQVSDDFLIKAHLEIRKNLEKFRELFGGNLIYIDNSKDSNVNFNKEWKRVKAWLERPVQNPRQHDWKMKELAKKHEQSWNPISGGGKYGQS